MGGRLIFFPFDFDRGLLRFQKHYEYFASLKKTINKKLKYERTYQDHQQRITF